MLLDIAKSDRAAEITPLILVEEISHRVVNEYAQAIADLRLAAADVASHEARTALMSVAGRLVRFADAHRALQAPRGTEVAELSEHLERLCAALAAAKLDDRGIGLTLLTKPVSLRADRCWRVTLVVAELITNAVRHGFGGGRGSIVVDLDVAGSDVICRVIDDGRPQQKPWPARGSSIVRSLAAELGGDISWSFGADGAIAELVVPLATQERLA